MRLPPPNTYGSGGRPSPGGVGHHSVGTSAADADNNSGYQHKHQQHQQQQQAPAPQNEVGSWGRGRSGSTIRSRPSSPVQHDNGDVGRGGGFHRRGSFGGGGGGGGSRPTSPVFGNGGGGSSMSGGASTTSSNKRFGGRATSGGGGSVPPSPSRNGGAGGMFPRTSPANGGGGIGGPSSTSAPSGAGGAGGGSSFQSARSALVNRINQNSSGTGGGTNAAAASPPPSVGSASGSSGGGGGPTRPGTPQRRGTTPVRGGGRDVTPGRNRGGGAAQVTRRRASFGGGGDATSSAASSSSSSSSSSPRKKSAAVDGNFREELERRDRRIAELEAERDGGLRRAVDNVDSFYSALLSRETAGGHNTSMASAGGDVEVSIHGIEEGLDHSSPNDLNYDEAREALIERLQSEYVVHVEKIESLQDQLRAERRRRGDRGAAGNASSSSDSSSENASALARQLDQCRSELSHLREEAESKSRRIRELEDENEERRVCYFSETNRLTEQLERVSSQLGSRRNSGGGGGSIEVVESAEVDRYKRLAQDRELELGRMKSALDKRDAQMSEAGGYKRLAEEQGAELEQLRSQVSEVDKYRQMARERDKELRQARSALEMKEAQISSLEKRAHTASDVDVLRSVATDQSEEIEQLKAELSERDARIASLEEQAENLNQFDMLRSVATDQSQEIERLQEALAERDDRIASLEKRAEVADNVDILKSLATDQSKELEDLRSALSERDEQISALEEERDGELEELRNALSDRDERISSLEERDGADSERIPLLTKRLDLLENEKREQHDKFTSIIVNLENDKQERQQRNATLQSEVHRLKMLVKEEAYAAGVEIVKILAEEEGRDSLRVDELQKDFLKNHEAQKDIAQPKVPPEATANKPENVSEDGKVTLDAVYVARLKQQLVASKIAGARYEKQIGFVKGICDQIVESLRAEITEMEAEKAELEMNMLNQIAKLSAEKATIEEDFKAKIESKDANIASMEKKLAEAKRSSGGGRASPFIPQARKQLAPVKGEGEDVASVSPSQRQQKPQQESPHDVSETSRSGGSKSGATPEEVRILRERVALLEQEKKSLEKEMEDKALAFDKEKEGLERELLFKLEEKEDKIMELYEKLGEMQQESCSANRDYPSDRSAVENTEESSAVLLAEQEARERQLKTKLEECEVKISELRQTASDQKQIIGTLSADLKRLQEKSSSSEDGGAPSLQKRELSEDQIVANLERVTLIHDQATASIETLQEMIREMEARQGEHAYAHRSGGTLSDGHRAEEREATLSILFKSKQVRENLKVSLQVLESKLMNRLDSLDDELSSGGPGGDMQEARDVVASFESKTVQIRDEARISLIEIEKEFLDKLGSIENELRNSEQTIISLEGKCSEQQRLLKSNKRRKGASKASRSLLDKLEKEVLATVQQVREKDEVINTLTNELQELQHETRDGINDRGNEKDAMIAKLENQLTQMKKKIHVLEYDYSWSESENSEKEKDELSPMKKASPFLKQVQAEKFSKDTSAGEHLGYC